MPTIRRCGFALLILIAAGPFPDAAIPQAPEGAPTLTSLFDAGGIRIETLENGQRPSRLRGSLTRATRHRRLLAPDGP